MIRPSRSSGRRAAVVLRPFTPGDEQAVLDVIPPIQRGEFGDLPPAFPRMTVDTRFYRLGP